MRRRQALAALAALPALPAWGRSRPRLQRSFLQPWRRHLEWTSAQWAGLFDWLHALSANQLVLQWTAWNGIDYSALAAQLAAGLESRRMKLWLGLAFDDEFWRWNPTSDDEAAALLAPWRKRSLALAQRLAAGAARSRAFAGWYLPEEFDAARWRAAPAAVRSHLDATRQALSRLSGKPVAASGFPSAAPAAAAAFWHSALDRRAVHELWMQDGIGAGKLSLPQWSPWAQPVAAAVRRARCRLSVVVESFEIVPASHFQARPAPLHRLLLQLEQARQLSQGPLTAFDIAEYMSPAGGEEASRLGSAYAAAAGIQLPEQVPSNRDAAVR